MSTYSFISKLRKGAYLPALLILAGILIALELVLPSVAFASPAHPAFDFGNSKALDRASVSVVRLVVTYTNVSSTPNPVGSTATPGLHRGGTSTIHCTGLGVLVKSWTATGTGELNNWIVTDSALVDPGAATCAPGNPTAQLSAIEILVSNAYTSTPSSISFSVDLKQIRCQTSPCNGASPALLPFHTDRSATQPFLDVDTTNAGQTGIELTDATHLSPSSQANIDLQQAQEFLTPSPVAFTDAQHLSAQNDAGMPIVSREGLLTGMQLTRVGLLPAANITSLMNNQPELQGSQQGHTNRVHDGWNQAITDYYAGRYSNVGADLNGIATVNPHFQAATTLANLAKAKMGGTKGGQPGSGGNATPKAGTGTLFPIVYLLLSILGIIVLLALLVLASLFFGRRRAQRHRELARFEEEQNAAEHKAALEAQRIRVAAEEAQRRQAQARPQPATPQMNRRASGNLQPVPNVPPPVPNVPPPAPPPPAAYHQPPPPLVPSASISDQPTVEMSPSSSRQNGQIETEKTMPYPSPPITMQRWQGRNMSLAVGTRSDPGIKRKHKPNEDSLFAAQGERTHDSRQQQFGLFVVADGMGGHASGQDASRLAIQTIVDRLLPKLSGSGELDDKALVDLLVEGVQRANLAVHERNVEHSADMGTTMTAALVVGTSAYVANVGDSRTYLYREPGGLKKITNDHSVVASLVDAGIIKPDDIYTHPKRNQIYRSLGEKPNIEVDSFIVQLQPNDKLLLCSDGLWDMVRDPEIQRIMSNPVPDPEQTGNALIKAALEGGGEDNVSVIVVNVTESTQRTGMTGIHLLAKPESVQLPPL